jgi:hypothetical protein
MTADSLQRHVLVPLSVIIDASTIGDPDLPQMERTDQLDAPIRGQSRNERRDQAVGSQPIRRDKLQPE